ncbi:MAG: hypothetical protein AAFZ07_20335 [Actinomycetota bacterium]
MTQREWHLELDPALGAVKRANASRGERKLLEALVLWTWGHEEAADRAVGDDAELNLEPSDVQLMEVAGVASDKTIRRWRAAVSPASPYLRIEYREGRRLVYTIDLERLHALTPARPDMPNDRGHSAPMTAVTPVTNDRGHPGQMTAVTPVTIDRGHPPASGGHTYSPEELNTNINTDTVVDVWGEVGAALAAAGVFAWRQAIDAARDNGCEPGHVLELVEVQRTAGLPPNVLQARVRGAHPTWSATEGWPTDVDVPRLLERAALRPYLERVRALDANGVRSLCEQLRDAGRPQLHAILEREHWRPHGHQINSSAKALRWLEGRER